MKICIMHTGHPKTGTTSLQHFLAGNADALRDRGILYPVLNRKEDLSKVLPWARYQHGPATKAMAMASGRDALNENPAIQDLELQIHKDPHDVLVISSESLFLETLIRNRSNVPDWFRTRGYAIETVSYVRDQPDRFNSAYSQDAKTLISSETFQDYVMRRLGNDPFDAVTSKQMSYGLLTNPDLALWGTHTFRPFADEVKRSGIEADFIMTMRAILDRRGMGDILTEAQSRSLVVPPRQNEGDGPVLVEAGRRIAASLLGLFADQEIPQFLRTKGFQDLVRAVDDLEIKSPKYSGLTPRLYKMIRRRFQKTNESFSRQIWGRPWDDVFPTRLRRNIVSNDVNDTGDPALLAQVDAVSGRVTSELLQDLEQGESFWELLMTSKPRGSEQIKAKGRHRAEHRNRAGNRT